MNRKWISLLLAAAMLLSLLTGCGGRADSSAQTAGSSPAEEASTSEAALTEAAQTETAPEIESASDTEPAEAEAKPAEYATVSYPITEEPLTLSIFWQFHMFLSMFGVTQDIIPTIPTFQMAEEATGVKLDFYLVGEENFGNSLQLLWASGDYCDLITNAEREYTAGVDSAVEQDILLDLVPYLGEHAPDYLRILDQHPDFRLDLTSSEGHIVSFSDYCEYYDNGVVIRKDWLDQVGMEVPKTMDEVTDVIRAFRDQLGIRNPVMWNSDLSTFFGWTAFGVSRPEMNGLGWQVLEDGKTVAPSVTLEGYRECLQWMHDAFEEKLCTDDGILASNYGIEGDGFVYDETGKPQYTDVIMNPGDMPVFVATFLHTSLVGTPYYNTTERKIASFTTEAERECIDVWLTGRTGADIYHGKLTMDESEAYNRTVSDIATAAAEQSLRFVTGDRSLDEYDSFLKDLDTMGLSRLTELKQAA